MLASASSAFAASATVVAGPGAIVDYRAGDGEANAVTATVFESTVTIADSGAAITPGSGCATIDPHTIRCALPSLPAQLAADLGDANDTLTVAGTLDTFADGGAGDDRLSGGAANDALIGGSGDDRLIGGAGADTLAGDGFAAALPGDDTLDGGPGADVISGDEGVDTADYSARTTAVEVRLDGLADDGGVEDAGGDSVDTENITAGAGDDDLVGDDSANLLRGGAGGDRLDGARGTDVLLGGDADDTLDARDGAPDSVSCDAGDADTALADGVDAVDGCERVPPALLTGPTVAETATVGQALTATPGTWLAIPAPSFAYRWLLCAPPGQPCGAITAATTATYTPASSDAGSALRVDVVATNPFGSGYATSALTAPVAAAPQPPGEATPTSTQGATSTTAPANEIAVASDAGVATPPPAAAAALGSQRAQLTLQAPRRVSLGALRRHLTVTVRCPLGQPATLLLTAPRLHAKSLRLARSTFTCSSATRRVALRVTSNLLRRVGTQVLLRLAVPGAAVRRTIAVRRAPRSRRLASGHRHRESGGRAGAFVAAAPAPSADTAVASDGDVGVPAHADGRLDVLRAPRQRAARHRPGTHGIPAWAQPDHEAAVVARAHPRNGALIRPPVHAHACRERSRSALRVRRNGLDRTGGARDDAPADPCARTGRRRRCQEGDQHEHARKPSRHNPSIGANVDLRACSRAVRPAWFPTTTMADFADHSAVAVDTPLQHDPG